VRIRNTLQLAEIQVSEPMLAEIARQPERFELVSGPVPFAFDANAALAPLTLTPHAAAA
jgi:hypothetical protein